MLISIRGTTQVQTDLCVVSLWQSFVQGSLLVVFQRQPFSIKVIRADLLLVHVEYSWLEMRSSGFILLFNSVFIFLSNMKNVQQFKPVPRGILFQSRCFFFVQCCLSERNEGLLQKQSINKLFKLWILVTGFETFTGRQTKQRTESFYQTSYFGIFMSRW